MAAASAAAMGAVSGSQGTAIVGKPMTVNEPQSHTDDLMPAEVRRRRILGLLADREYMRVADLAAVFRTSEVTIRSDLTLLAADGHVTRVRGGAMPRFARRPHRELPFAESLLEHATEKWAIGHHAAQLVQSADSVIIDVGTTTTAVARALAARDDLHDVTVFTNGLNIAMELEAGTPRLSVVVLGGTLRPMQHSLVDPLGGVILERITANIAFIGAHGLDPAAGLTNANIAEAEMKRRMLLAARRRVVVADGSKLGVVSLARICAASDIDLVLTGPSADPPTVAALRDAGPEVQIVP
jgi:DeoR family transcriptional regulator of aga operon